MEKKKESDQVGWTEGMKKKKNEKKKAIDMK